MTDANDKTEPKKTLSLGGGGGTLSLKPGVGGPKSIMAGGRGPSRPVAVEVRKKRGVLPTAQEQANIEEGIPARNEGLSNELRQLTTGEREARMKALQQAAAEAERRKIEEALAPKPVAATGTAPEAPKLSDADRARQQEIEELQRIEAEEDQKKKAAEKQRNFGIVPPGTPDAASPYKPDAGLRLKKTGLAADEEEEESYRARMKRTTSNVRAPRARPEQNAGPGRKITVTQVLNQDYDRDRGMSLAARRRAAQKHRLAGTQETVKQSREVVVPEAITVQELANRMAEKASDVIKSLMKMGVMATINDPIDPDTAELIVGEFGHTIKRVTEADIEEGIEGEDSADEHLVARPPVVTIMGHVDHGKTSLLDALRQTDVVSGEAGGITQHIGAYQVQMKGGQKITFLDTPGHAAFTEMRARGANVTDIVVLVVAANDSIMPQTIEAISHAKAAGVPILVAINKVDLPDANVAKVKQDLLQHELIVEELGGDTLTVEVSAKKKTGLDKLEETILLQAEVLNLRANPDRHAVGTVVEARLEQGRGHVATVLIQEGTLRVGDVFVMGAETGRVRSIFDDHGKQIKLAVPGQPVEVLGLNGSPHAGDRLVVVEDEAKARDIAEYRQRKRREVESIRRGSGRTFEEKLALAKAGAKKELPVLVKGDVHGSVEAIIGSLRKLEEDNDEIAIRVLHSGVGPITESDVTLAAASGGLIIGFNVRANAQARELVEREGVDMRYYTIIYNVIDDAKAMMGGMMAPVVREEYLGQASARQVFNITKVGKVAGCMVTKGIVKRGAKVRLLREDVIIHEGTLKTLKRFKDEVKEVKEGMECGMAFENYEDIREGDIIECFEIVTEARVMA